MKNFEKLVSIVAALRDKESGCPWDVKQTRDTLVPNFIEELHEVIEAIEDKDYLALREELGDLMLHIVFQAQISDELGLWNINEVLNAINDKLVRRHPHVFSDLNLDDADAVKMNWERIKQREKKERKSVLDGVPRSLPALIQAQRIQEKAASVGFDWPDLTPIFNKLDEERGELEAALEGQDPDQIQDELGDLLFTLVNLARKLHLDAEAALKQTTRKFIRRFNHIEEHYKHEDKAIYEASLEELDAIWEKAKKR